MSDRTPQHRLFLIGSEASGAMSPGLWTPVFEELGIPWTYEAWDVPGNHPMDGVRAGLLAADVIAANVTMPHKQWAAATADTRTEQVRLGGAANLLVRQGSTLSAHNTDISAVEELLGAGHQRHVLMLGAGGAALAALVALRGRVQWLTVTDRDPQAAELLLARATGMGIRGAALPWAEGQGQAHLASLIINATPIGKNADDGPAWGKSELAPDAFVYDFVYSSHVTASIIQAREQGIACADGWDHLLMQAVAMIPLLDLPHQTNALLEQSLTRIQVKA